MCHDFVLSVSRPSEFPISCCISGCLWPSDTWALKSEFSTPQPSFPILPVHASIAAPNRSSSFFQTEIVQAFTKTFPSLIYQDFINPTIILRVLRYPFAQTQVTPPASTLAALRIASFTCIPLHLKVSSLSEVTPKHAGRQTKNPKRQEVLFWKEPAGVNYTFKLLRGLEAAVTRSALSRALQNSAHWDQQYACKFWT